MTQPTIKQMKTAEQWWEENCERFRLDDWYDWQHISLIKEIQENAIRAALTAQALPEEHIIYLPTGCTLHGFSCSVRMADGTYITKADAVDPYKAADLASQAAMRAAKDGA